MRHAPANPVTPSAAMRSAPGRVNEPRATSISVASWVELRPRPASGARFGTGR